MKIKFRFIIPLFFLLFACGDNSESKSPNGLPTSEALKEIIKEKEDSLMNFQKEGKLIPEQKHYELIKSLLTFQRIYPKDPYAPVCLDKVQMSYSGLGVYFKAIQYTDSLIENYPKYVNRPLVLESQASNYDIFNQPRDTAKVRYYYTLLLKENPSMKKSKKKEIELRLKHLDLNIDQYINFLSSQHKK